MTAARVYVPSIVAPGEPFQLSVRSEDRWSNRSSGPIPAYEVLLDGKPWRKLPAGERAVQLIADARIDQPGIHRFSVESSDGEVSATSNPVWVREDAGRRVYWGETHGHCGFGEGQGSPTSFFEFGRDDSRLDFLTVTEHDALTDDGEWRQLDQLVRRFNDDGKFVTFLGYEWSAQRPQGGHHNVIFREPGHRRIALQEYPVLPLLYQGLRAENDLDRRADHPARPQRRRLDAQRPRSGEVGRGVVAARHLRVVRQPLPEERLRRSASSAPPTTTAPIPACRSRCRGRS